MTKPGLLLVLLVLASLPALAQERLDPEEIRRLAGEVLDDGAYQTELPDEPEPRALPDLPMFSIFGPAIGWILLVLLGLGLAAFLLYVVGQVWQNRGRSRAPSVEGARDAVEPGAPGAPRPGARPGVPSWAEVEAMVAQGALGEAVRALLVRAVLRLSTTGPGRAFPSSWTSREILGSAPVEGDRRSALALLVGTVEGWLFGGRPVTEDEARQCLAAARHLGDGPGVAP